MECGRVVSTYSSVFLPACVCVLLMLTAADARPKNTNEALSDWSPEWQQVADWWMPKTDKDKWRAFEPMKETSTTQWWKEKLDDDLWDPKAHEASPGTLERSPPTQPSPVLTTKLDNDFEGEKKANITSKLETKAETSMWTTTTAKSHEPFFSQPLYKKGEVNSFVEPDPASYYSSSGEYYASNVWDSSYSKPHQSKDPFISQESKQPLVSQKNKELVVPQENKKSNVGEKRKEPSNPQSRTFLEENTLTLKDAPKQDQAPLIPAENFSKTIKEKESVELRKEDMQLSHAPAKEVGAAPSSESIRSNTLIKNQDTNVPISSADVADGSSEVKEKPASEVSGHKMGTPVVGGTNAIYGKGESLSLLPMSAVDVQDEGKESVVITKKPDEVTTKKPGSDFVDWDGWDNSVFDYYEYDEKNDSGNGNKEIKEDNIAGSSENIKNHNMVKDDNEDNYDEDDDEFEDEDEKSGQHHITKGKNGKITISAVNEKKQDISSKTDPPPKSGKGYEFDTIDMQSDDAASHVDHSHYSKGIIYDLGYPNHKPSVKKDLTNPANLKKDDLSGNDKGEVTSVIENSEPQNVAVKKTLSVTHFQTGQLNTESDVSTSPNPPPPGVASNKESSGTRAPTTTPITSGDQMNLAVENLVKQKPEDNSGFVLSFPLEFCRVDYECRAGRTCVQGVCKCYTPAMCAGHHKPICGSDGLQYASHCELHRTACVNRVHIRADRRGKCFQKEIEEQEKSWLMEQERLLQEDREKQKAQADQSAKIPSQEILQYPQNVKKDPETANVNSVPQIIDEKVPVVTEKTTTTDTVTQASSECTWKDMSKFKDDLLMYYCQKFVEPNCKEEVKTDREYLSMLMFSYYDKDYDYYLTAEELDDKERDEHFTSKIILNCHLHDFIRFADNLEADSKLTVSEFTSAFEPPIPSIPPHAQVEVISTLASAGNGLELKCGIDAETVVWRRHGAQLSDDKRSHQLMVFDDGALFFSTVGLHHIGNYTCMDASDESNAQIHRLKVQTLPVVEVSPVTQTHVTGSDIELKCHAEGVPEPVVAWTHGGDRLEYSAHITHYYGGGHVVIHSAQFDTDAGTYTCSAHNQAGTTEKTVSVSVLPPSAPYSKESSKDAGTFMVYHSKGMSAYDPLSCLPRHQVSGDFGNFKFIPDALDGPLTLCRKGEDCRWGAAVKVGSEFIYISQPDQNRVVVMNAVDSLNPLQVIDTDKGPEKLWYVKHLDQVWVLCGNHGHGEGNKTIVVIRDASQHIQHRSVHTQPVGNHFDMVQDLFIAPSNDLNHEFDFGYVSHKGQNGLFKISLEDMSYTKSIDLTNYGCVPITLAFVPIGGHVVIRCVSAADQHTLQLTMDYLTDTITSATSHNGRPMTSPDSRHLVTVDLFTGRVIATSVSDEGVLDTTYEVTVSASISDVTFMTAMSHHGYDLVLTSADDDDVIIMNLVTGKIEKLKGSKYSDNSSSWKPTPIHRHIVTGNSMSNFLMTPSKSSLAILDAKFKQVQCEFLDSVGSDVMIYIPGTYTS